MAGDEKTLRGIHTHTHAGLRIHRQPQTHYIYHKYTGMFTQTDTHALPQSCMVININLSTYNSTCMRGSMAEEITAEILQPDWD